VERKERNSEKEERRCGIVLQTGDKGKELTNKGISERE
jgi:hypothetical protein